MSDRLLEITNLVTEFHLESGWYPAVNGVSIHLNKGEVLGLVGESGSGKTMTALSLIGLLPKNGRIASGSICFEGKNVLSYTSGQLREMRGKQISMIFQDPMSALDPVYSCGKQIKEAILSHQKISRHDLETRCLDLLKWVGIREPKKFLEAYPHELSGGMCQRVMIAMALAMNPQLLIADEPTTALDVTVQAMILDLLKKLRQESGMSILFISHDLGVVSEIADRVAVMYGGNIVEQGMIDEVFHNPKHPYTRGLIASVPRLDSGKERLSCITGVVPDIESFPVGCRFSNRCPYVTERCLQESPPTTGSDSHSVACWNLINGGGS